MRTNQKKDLPLKYSVWEATPEIVTVADECLFYRPNTTTLTGNLHRLVAELKAAGILTGQPLIYRDTMRGWDYVLYTMGTKNARWEHIEGGGAIIDYNEAKLKAIENWETTKIFLRV